MGLGFPDSSLGCHLRPIVPTTKNQGSSQGDYLYWTLYHLSNPREGTGLQTLSSLSLVFSYTSLTFL